MKTNPPPSTLGEIDTIFRNVDPEVVWHKAMDIVMRISANYDSSLTRTVFNDVMHLFQGEYPGYFAIQTLYHDQRHTLDVFICAIRLMRGMHLSGTRFDDEDISLVIIATLMHDVGYAQHEGEEGGTGAQFTSSHVSRGIDFMRHYLGNLNCPPAHALSLKFIMRSTDVDFPFQNIGFPDQHSRLLGQVVGTADIVGQMADRAYLEKLQYLYLEFKEANLGDYQSTYDLLCKTRSFYKVTREKLDGVYDSLYTKLSFYFLDAIGDNKNYYLESIEKNIAYLSKITALNEEQYQSMLKRRSKLEKSENTDEPDSSDGSNSAA
jgi:hypothetical protein